jgi:hypothetical protein
MIRWIKEGRERAKLRRSIALRHTLADASGPVSVFELARRSRVPIDYADWALELWWIAGLLHRESSGEEPYRRHAYQLTTKGRAWALPETDEGKAA